MAAIVPKKIKVPKKTDKKGDLPSTEEEWVTYVNKVHDESIGVRKKYELQWVMNSAYMNGYQDLIFNPRSGVIEFPDEPRVRLTVNRVGSFVESRHAKLTKSRPVPRVIPNTTDWKDQRAAKYSDQALRHLWRTTEMEKELDRLIILMLQQGNAFLKVIWNPLAGDVVKELKKKTIPSGGQELFIAEDGQFEEEDIFMGEVSTKAMSAFSLIPSNDQVPNIQDQDWIIERTFLSLAEIERLYPHLRGEFVGRERYAQRTEYERMMERLSSALFHTESSRALSKSDSVNSEFLVKTMWMKPNWQFEKGVVCVVIEDKLAMIGPFPNFYGANMYPFVRFTEKNDGFHFWQQSTIERIIPIQRTFNTLTEQTANNAVLCANQKWMLPKGSQVSEESITDIEGEVVEYNPAVPEPHMANLAPMPNYVAAFRNELIADLRDVGGQREASVSPPPNLTAAVALQTAAEQADEIVGPIIRRMAKSIEITANIQLLLMNSEWTDKRRIKIIGERGPSSVVFLNNRDLNNNTDVHIEVESLFPDFRGAKLEKLTSWWDRRIIQDPQKFLRAARFGDIDSLIEDEEIKMDTVFFDIQKLKKGKMPEVNAVQNHILYVKELTKFIQTPEFLQLIPERKQLVIQALQQHIQFIMPQLPGGGEAVPQQNQAAVGGGTLGPITPAGAPGGGR